ncbi:NAD(P)/FAD-dependent oxidoreductase [Salinicola halophilus]|uniref:NAD(P)/FAD-dependent oxidoreductase n=1 Tax=Salinicola halophilus TaxID=184065 RepID=UPI000DA12DE3|nr:FAD-dependent oxidoreductase [Salinicola halophilus]
MANYDFAVVGGGLVGSAIAYGLSGAGHSVVVLDEGDVAYRASRGNFGLVWVQSKGLGMPNYSDWSQSSSTLWQELAPELEALTGIDVQHRRPGGVHICHTEQEWRERRRTMENLAAQTSGRFRFDMLDHAALASLVPAIGDDVFGASWTEMDGHANPLYLLRALHAGVQKRGGHYCTGGPVRRVIRDGESFRLERDGQSIRSERVILAAGLGNRELAKQVGLEAPLSPNRGEVMITERVAPLLDIPTTYLRQTAEGSLQIGDSHEDVGMNDGTRTEVLAEIAQRALRAFPRLRDVRIVRTWGALRVMTPDGFPIYQASKTHPGAYLACCHSGVTLAAAHAMRLAPWIAGGASPQEIVPLTAERFDVRVPETA